MSVIAHSELKRLIREGVVITTAASPDSKRICPKRS